MTKKIDLGLDESSLRKARRKEFPNMLRNLVEEGHPALQLILTPEVALKIADDIEFAIENKPNSKDSWDA